MQIFGGKISSAVPSIRWLRSLAALAAFAAALFIWVDEADARLEGGFGHGGREAWTFASPLVATTLPQELVALDRASPSQAAQPIYPGGSLGGLFNRPGLLGGFAAGFLGAGLFGLLFGRGIFGGLGPMVSYLGLMFQLALLAMLARLIWRWWHDRNATAASLSPRQLADAYERSREELRTEFGSFAFADLEIVESDYECFEHLFREIQSAYGREDFEALRAFMTPEMLSVFSKNPVRSADGSVDLVSDVRLLKDDSAKGWREGDIDYAVVTMSSSLRDRMRTKGTWTFMRAPGHCWQLSAIRQAA